MGEVVERADVASTVMRRLPTSTSSNCMVRIIIGRAAWTAAKAMMSRTSGVVAVAMASSMSAWTRAWRTPPVCRGTRMRIVGLLKIWPFFFACRNSDRSATTRLSRCFPCSVPGREDVLPGDFPQDGPSGWTTPAAPAGSHPGRPMSYAGSEAPTAGHRRGECGPTLRQRDGCPGHPVEFSLQPPVQAGTRSSVNRPRRSRTSAVRTMGSPRTRKAGKSSEYRIDSPSRESDNTVTRARFTSLVIQWLQPRASPSAERLAGPGSARDWPGRRGVPGRTGGSPEWR